MNLKKLYASDGHAVQELLKVASMLYSALKAQPPGADGDIDDDAPFAVNAKLQDLKVRIMATWQGGKVATW